MSSATAISADVLSVVEHIRRVGGFTYLASPYTLYPPSAGGPSQAAHRSAAAAAFLRQHGVSVYAPVPQGHAEMLAGNLYARAADSDWWVQGDLPILEKASCLTVLQLLTWESSAGIKTELAQMQLIGRPVFHLPYPYEEVIAHDDYSKGAKA